MSLICPTEQSDIDRMQSLSIFSSLVYCPAPVDGTGLGEGVQGRRLWRCSASDALARLAQGKRNGHVV